jgi:hypothetical protein
MKKIYHNFITKEEASLLKEISSVKLLESKNIIIDKIINQLKKDFKFTIKEQSYCYTEKYPLGHGWHVDTGNNNHMSWCEVGVSILLENPTSGGYTYYADNINGDNKIRSDRKLYDLIAHTSDVYHMVEPHVGSRNVFLIFI